MSYQNRKVLVTGGNGFLGTHLVRELKKAGCQVTSLAKDIHKNKEVGVTHFCGDVRDAGKIRELLKADFDFIFHLAGLVSVVDSVKEPALYFDVNVNGTLMLLEEVRKAGRGCRIIFSSTGLIYGNPLYTPVDEKHQISPASPYAASKAAADALCQAYGRSYGMDISILRLFNIYGPGQSAANLIPSVAIQALKGNTIKIGSPGSTRDFCYVKDAIEAFIRVGLSDRRGEVYNLGTGISTRVETIAKMIARIANIDARIEVDESKVREGESGMLDVKADNSRLASTGWKPRYSLDKGLSETVEWYKDNINSFS